jgi:hypothetical protein
MMDILMIITAIAYFASGLVGWAISIGARFSKRYHPALSLAGTAIGLMPTYSLTVVLLRRFGAVSYEVDVWQRVTILLVCVAIVALGINSFIYVVRGVREERALARRGLQS